MNKDRLAEQWKDQGSEGHKSKKTGNSPVANENAGGKCYGLVREGIFPPYLDIVCRNGHDLSLPYTSLPHCEILPDELDPAKGLQLIIMDFEFEIIIKGRGLAKLKKQLRGGKLEWIKENPSTTDDGTGDVFISDIAIHRRKS